MLLLLLLLLLILHQMFKLLQLKHELHEAEEAQRLDSKTHPIVRLFQGTGWRLLSWLHTPVYRQFLTPNVCAFSDFLHHFFFCGFSSFRFATFFKEGTAGHDAAGMTATQATVLRYFELVDIVHMP